MSSLRHPLVDRDELRRIVRLAVPVVAAHVATMAMGVTDVLMVGRFDAGALSGVALGHAWVWATMVLVRGAALGLDPLLTQAVGAGDRAAYRRALSHGMLLVGGVLVLALAAMVSAPWALAALGQPASDVPLAGRYARVIALGAVPVGIEAVLRQALQSRGHMRPAMIVAVGGAVINVPLNLALIHGAFGWGGLGAIGVAYASLCVQLCMAATTAWIARQELGVLAEGLREIRWATVLGVGGVALPVALSFALETWGFSIALVLVGWEGSVAIAAHTVALNVASFTFMVPLGVSAAAATRVGNLLGAGQPWTRAGTTAIALAVAIMATSGVTLALLSHGIAGLYLPRPEDLDARALAASLLPFAAAFQVFDGIQVVAFGVLRGAGDTRVPTLANVLGYYVIGLPLAAFLLASGWGVRGVWVGLAVALGSVALLLLGRLRYVARVGGFRRDA